MANHEAVIKDFPPVISVIAFTCFALLNVAERKLRNVLPQSGMFSAKECYVLSRETCYCFHSISSDRDSVKVCFDASCIMRRLVVH